MTDGTVLDEYANYHYKDLQEMTNSPEHQRLIKHIRQLVDEGKITIYPSLPHEKKVRKNCRK